MKTFICITVIGLSLFILAMSEVCAQMPGDEGYTIINGPDGAQVCVGKWVPSNDVALPGFCDGQFVELNQFTALSARQSADRLYQVLKALTSIDQKLAVNNDQIKQLIEATINPQVSNERLRQGNFLRERITKRFDELSKGMPANGLSREQIAELKEDILKEIDKFYPTPAERTGPQPK